MEDKSNKKSNPKSRSTRKSDLDLELDNPEVLITNLFPNVLSWSTSNIQFLLKLPVEDIKIICKHLDEKEFQDLDHETAAMLNISTLGQAKIRINKGKSNLKAIKSIHLNPFNPKDAQTSVKMFEIHMALNKIPNDIWITHFMTTLPSDIFNWATLRTNMTWEEFKDQVLRKFAHTKEDAINQLLGLKQKPTQTIQQYGLIWQNLALEAGFFSNPESALVTITFLSSINENLRNLWMRSLKSADSFEALIAQLKLLEKTIIKTKSKSVKDDQQDSSVPWGERTCDLPGHGSHLNSECRVKKGQLKNKRPKDDTNAEQDDSDAKKQKTPNEIPRCYDGKECKRNKCRFAHYSVNHAHQSTGLSTRFRTSLFLKDFSLTTWRRIDKVLQDTGATISLINHSFAKKLGLTFHPLTPQITILSAQGKLMKTKAQADVYITLDVNNPTQTIPTKLVIVKNLKENILIGTDILDQLGAQLVFTGVVNNLDTQITELESEWTREMIQIRFDFLKNSTTKHAPPSKIRPVDLEFIKDPFDTPNIRVKPEIPPQAWREEIDRTHQELLDAGLISPVRPEEVHNPVRTRFVKEDSKIRWATNLKSKNQFIRRQHHPLPSIDLLIKIIAAKKYFSKIDLKSGFFQIRLSSRSRSVTAFITYKGCFLWNVIPQGINIGSEAFQIRMEEVFGDIPNLHIFIDDLIVATDNIQDHISTLKQILARAKEYDVLFNSKKIDLFCRKLKILGHTITPGHINVDETRYKPVKMMATPKNAKDIQRVLGFFSYFRDHIPHLASIATPLYQISRPNTFQWQDAHQQTFDDLKRAFLTCKPLIAPDFQKEFFLETDSSGKGWGAALLQEGGVVSFASGVYNKHQYQYKATKSELLALRMACRKFHHFLAGRQFTWITDCKALVPLDGVKGDFHGIMSIWIEEILSNYDIIPIYRPGATMTLPDTLSRHRIERVHDVMNVSHELVLTDLPAPLKELQLACPEIGILIQKKPFIIDETEDAYFMVKDNLRRIILPQSLWFETVLSTHKISIHPSKQITYQILKSKFWFPNMKTIVGQIVKQCHTCQTCKTTTQRLVPLRRSFLKPQYPHQILCLDYIGPKKRVPGRSEDGFLLVVDAWSKKAYHHLVIGADAQEIVRAFKRIYETLPIQHKVITVFSDCGSVFSSELWKAQMGSLGIHTLLAAPKHQESNGIAERTWRSIKSIHQVLHMDYPTLSWYQTIPMAIKTYNMRPREPANFTPNQLAACSQSLLYDFQNILQQEWVKKLKKQEQFEPHDFKTGDRVMLKNTSTVKSKEDRIPWLGPYSIQSIQGSVMVKLSNKRELQSVVDLKPYFKPDQDHSSINIPLDEVEATLMNDSTLSRIYNST
ncbi:MAG: reverse transcriptase domain-containing protein [Candidatus Paceibacterota bacterium]